MDTPDWLQEAACRGVSPKVFVPDESNDKDETSAAHVRALRICKYCKVAPECLAYALAMNEQFGVWGNTTPRQRRRLKELELHGVR